MTPADSARHLPVLELPGLEAQGRARLDGVWEFFPGDHRREDLDGLVGAPITVPGLWEAQGYLDLDGVAWYRTRFPLANPSGYWTLRFGAVMDFAEVYLNGTLIGGHDQAFTPFELDATAALKSGTNILDVRVTDPSVDDPEHPRLMHGKQGWANHVFPSRPSLYLTYGGIWQSVTLARHGAVVIDDIWVDSEPDDLTITVEVTNRGAQPVTARLGVRSLRTVYEADLVLDGGQRRSVAVYLGATGAARWSPSAPEMHLARAEVRVAGLVSDSAEVRYGIRTVRVERDRILINGEPYRMKSVLVQGFTADRLYAEGTRAEITEEVRAAQAMGFNTVRLHIKAFDPVYLDVCDELGMLVHCDLPVAEPIAHDELGDGTLLSRRAVAAITQQVRRDRNHPSIILWSAMNELGLDGPPGTRESEVYAQFARTLYATVRGVDPTRPVIENDWVEPDPDRVFSSPILTAHWYGRLHADYLDKLERESLRWAGVARPLYITEFGDWGLPDMPKLEEAPFWDSREVYAAGLAGSRWPDTIGRFLIETHRYQGLSDRLQLEVFRRHDHIGGYCVTELTDVPHEFNGLLDLYRRPKPIAVQEITRGNQTVLPMLHMDRLVATGGEAIQATAHIANDGPPLQDVELRLRFGHSGVDEPGLHVPELPGHRAVRVGSVTLAAPDVPGNHDLLLSLYARGELVAENRYPIHVVTPSPSSTRYPLRVLGATSRAALADVGALPTDGGPLVVGEGELDAQAGADAARTLAAGGTVVVLAQRPEAADHYPIDVELAPVDTAWGSSTFHFTTDSGALPSLPRRNLLVGEESTVQATSVLASVDGAVFPSEPVVIAYKPVPGAITGTVVGRHQVGDGRLLLCQYRLVEPARRGDAAARALLGDLVRWAADPRPEMAMATVPSDDGRVITYYGYEEGSGR
ncbi:MAG TPA: glycoside hydrolase family 2 TIM barrel-domain containing protein [Micromonosporaceae bacterium]|nr:glycoside hydrolase family 2 TIM barrel-domain containing protein [Micromonosporaceae bacterium]